MSGNTSELQERMLSRQRQARLRDMALDGLALAAFVLSLGSGAFLLWHQVIQ